MGKTVKKIRSEGISHIKNAKKPNKPILLPDRDASVAKIAYYKAKSRNFRPGHELDDLVGVRKRTQFLVIENRMIAVQVVSITCLNLMKQSWRIL
jgi:hypothetical protein